MSNSQTSSGDQRDDRADQWRRYALVLCLFGAALVLRLVLAPIDGSLAFLTFYPAAAVAFITLGIGPGWMLVALGSLTGYYVFTAPHWSFEWSKLGLLNLSAYIASAGLIAWAVARQRETSERLGLALTQVQEREHLLKERESFYQRVTDRLPVRLAYCDRDARYRFVNEEHCRRFGLAREDILGRTRAEIMGVPHDDRVAQRIAAVLAGKEQQFEYEEHVQGQFKRIQAHLVPELNAAGEVIGFFSSGTDVTERFKIQRALEESESLLLQTSHVAGVGGWQLDLTTNILTWSAQTRLIHEVDADFVPSLETALNFYDESARADIEAAVQAGIAQGTGWDLELPFTTAKGRPLWVHAVGEVQRQDGQPVKLIGAFQDITERRTLQGQLAEVAARSADLYDNAPCGYYSIDATGKFVELNALTLSWLGCAREDVLNQLGPTDFFSAQGRESFAKNLPIFLREGKIGPLEFELISRDGMHRWVSVTATAVRDASGEFLRSRSVMYDVSELHHARAQYRQLAAEQAAMLDNELVAIVKLKNRVAVWKNKALERLFGYTHEELIHQPSRMLYADEATYQDVGASAYAAIAAGGHVQRQVQMRHKDGRIIWVDLSGFLISPETGETMWLMTDITALKELQARTEHVAFHDALTGLPNRLLLSDRLVQALALCHRQDEAALVCYLDLDGFKAVNDQHGHVAGDVVLQATSRRLQACLRASDTVARLGGDEFVILISPLASEQEGRAVLQRLIKVVAEPIDIGEVTCVSVSASIGVAAYPADGATADELLQRADRSMYESKRQGKNQISGFAPLAD